MLLLSCCFFVLVLCGRWCYALTLALKPKFVALRLKALALGMNLKLRPSGMAWYMIFFRVICTFLASYNELLISFQKWSLVTWDHFSFNLLVRPVMFASKTALGVGLGLDLASSGLVNITVHCTIYVCVRCVCVSDNVLMALTVLFLSLSTEDVVFFVCVTCPCSFFD